MERDNFDNYYHSGVGAENRRNQSHGSNYGHDLGRGYDRRPDNENGRSREERRHDMQQFTNNARLRSGNNDFNNPDYREYQRHHNDLRNEYRQHVRRDQDNLENIRQGYGFPGFDNEERSGGQYRPRQEQGYNSGRMSGYSGSAFGGANYSSHGGFGGAPEYGAMSGGIGNIDTYTSSSGYGGGYTSDHHNRNRHTGRSRYPETGHRVYGQDISDNNHQANAYNELTGRQTFGQSGSGLSAGRIGGFTDTEGLNHGNYRPYNEQNW